MPPHPEVLWAQRSSESETKKVNLPNIIANTLEYKLTPTSISFKAKAGDASKGLEEKTFDFDLELYAEVIPEESRQSLSSRHFAVVLQKKETKLEYWPRLIKDKTKLLFLKTDFSKWVDEDEQDGEVINEPEDDGLGGMGGMGGAGGMDFEAMMKSMGGAGGPALGGLGGDIGSSANLDDGSDDSDDDGPPPLEEANS